MARARYAPRVDPAPVTVWMVNRRTGPNGLKGTLKLEPEHLVFSPKDERASPTIFERAQIRRARRVRGAPVLEIKLASESDVRILGFYFVQPPNLVPEQSGMLKKRRARSDAVATLRSWNPVKKETIVEWVKAIDACRA
jgi:hypothetical protein